MRQFVWRFMALALLWAFFAVSMVNWGLAYSGSDSAGVGSQASGTGPEIPASQQDNEDGDEDDGDEDEEGGGGLPGGLTGAGEDLQFN